MSDLIHEVEEAVKQERLEKLWKEYGGYLIAAIALTILMTAVITGWRNWNERVNTTQTTAIIEALDQEDKVAALDAIADTLRPEQRAIAYVTAAGLLAREDKNEEALAHYQKAAADKELPALFRDLAQLMAVRLEWAMQKPETDAAQLLAALKTLWDGSGSPWQWHAHMQAAVIQAHAFENYKTARDHLAAIGTHKDEVPRSLLERAAALEHIYAIKMAASAENNAAAAAANEEPEG